MIKNAEAHADEAHKLRELADARNEAEALAYQTEKSLKEHREKLDESVASTVEGRIMELRGVLESGDVAEIQRQDATRSRRRGRRPPRRSTRRRPPRRRRRATAARALGRRGDRGRRLRGRRRRRRGQDLLSEDRAEERRSATARPEAAGGSRLRTPVADPGRRARSTSWPTVTRAARRVPRRAPAAQGRVRQLPQAGRARPGRRSSRARPSGWSSSCCRCSTTSSGRSRRRSSTRRLKLEDGVRLVHRALADMLAREGLVEVETDGRVRPAHAGGAALAAVRGSPRAR